MVQSINWPAIRTTARVLFGQPSLAVPHVDLRDIRDIDFARLRSAGCEGVVFDKDNTLTAPYKDEVDARLARALSDCSNAFGPSRVVVLSNSAGTPDDPDHRAADRIERTLGLPVLRREVKKPRGFESVRAHFAGCDPTALVMIGDRYLTDVVFGNLHGMLCVRTEQLTSRGDNPVAARMAQLERWLVRLFRWRGCRPPHHRLAAALVNASRLRS